MARTTNPTLDIHRYDRKYEDARKSLLRSAVSDRNKDLILRYRDACLLKGVCSRVRLIRVIGALKVMGVALGRDFDTATKVDLQGLVAGLMQHQPAYSAETLGAYKAILRSFYTWLVLPDEFPTRHYPPIVAWLNCHVKARDKMRLSRHELLTPQDIESLLRVCHNPRDRAFISVLWETGTRVSEIGNLQLKHVTKHQHGFTLEVTGKTGTRSPLIIASAPYLTFWLNHHPFAENPENPLWVHYQYEHTPGFLKYDTIRNMLKNMFERAGITKPFHPHAFRHARATFLLARGVLTEAQAKVYFGWSPCSEQLATYAHLIDHDANHALLREHGLAPPQRQQEDLTPVECGICGTLNPPRTFLCMRCGTTSSPSMPLHQATLLPDDRLKLLLKGLVDRGLGDDAVQLIHDVGLGPTLQRLISDRENQQSPS
ncbi:MAG: tyrosine-type recombinase/integrase [Bryobacteraceae bacterium]|nr:tyrosine-type recombinase/integrase [Bryobacteraceae bacterium]